MMHRAAAAKRPLAPKLVPAGGDGVAAPHLTERMRTTVAHGGLYGKPASHLHSTA